MRQRVDQQRIELFLQQLGRRFTKPGRVYLVGGTTMVYEGLRQQTLDIDLALEIADEDHSTFIATVRELKERYSLNIEFQRKFAILREMWSRAGNSTKEEQQP